jgi:hypothetical protein
MFKVNISTLGVLTLDRLPLFLGLLPSSQMMVIEMIVHNGRTAIYKGALFTRESLITDTIRILRST